MIEPIGQGGMGSVFKARRKSDSRLVALKLIRSDLDENLEKALKMRFKRELNVSKTLAHPYVVKILDGGFVERGGTAFIVMDYINGESLADHYERGFDLALLKQFFQQMVEALAYIHEIGVVHRDIKPGNIVIDDDGRCVLVDFGLALASNMTRITATSERPGTLTTMSPEQLRAEEIDGRSDIYSLGVTAYMYVAGQPPYSADELFGLALGNKPPTPPRLRDIEPGFPSDWDNLIFKCFALNKEKRFSSAKTLLHTLDKLRSKESSITAEWAEEPPLEVQKELSKPVHPRRSRKAALLIALLILIPFIFFLVTTKPGRKDKLTVSDWSHRLAKLRSELLAEGKFTEKSSFETLGDLAKKAQFARRLELTGEEPAALIGTYYLVRFCIEQKQYEKAEELFVFLLNSEELLNSSVKARYKFELKVLRVKIATELLQPWHDKPPSNQRTEVAQRVLSVMRPIVRHIPVVSNWPLACRTYMQALRYLATNEATEEAIEFVTYCQESKMKRDDKDEAMLQVVGLLRAYSGFGIEGKKSEHLYVALKLSQDVLSRKTIPNERWMIVGSIVDLQASLGKYEEAEKTLEKAINEMPQFLGTAGYYQQRASLFVHQGNYKKGIATLKKALTLKLSADERAYINRTLLEWRSYSSLLNK